MIDWLPPDFLRSFVCGRAGQELFARRRARPSIAISNARLIAGRWPDNAQRVVRHPWRRFTDFALSLERFVIP
jgi:hypothetical protein